MRGLGNSCYFRQTTRCFAGVITPKGKRFRTADGNKVLQIQHTVYSDNGHHFIKEVLLNSIGFAKR